MAGKLSLRKLRRIPEVLACTLSSPQWLRLTAGYLRRPNLEYPFILRTRSGTQIELADYSELTTAWHVLFGGEYRLNQTHRRIVDLGANIGVFTLWAAQEVPDAQIVAVEPFPATFERLLQNLRRNELNGRVVCRQAAVTAEDGPVRMDGRPSTSSYCRSIVWHVDTDDSIEVPGCSLGTIVNDAKFEEVDLLKVDIEGAEYDLFRGSSDHVLRRCGTIVFEYHAATDLGGAEKLDRLWKRLKGLGFRCTRHNPVGWSGLAEFTRT